MRMEKQSTKIEVKHDEGERNFEVMLVEDKSDHFMVEGRYAIYKSDGCVYDTLEAKDIPQHIFDLRDELLPQFSIDAYMDRIADEEVKWGEERSVTE